MSELLKAFDLYNDFELDSYFTLSFDTLPSNLYFQIHLESTKENMDKVLELMSLSESSYEIIFKNWVTEDSKDSDFSKDFPFEYLFKGVDKKSVIWISLENDTLLVDFYYDCKDVELENWIVEINHKLRKKFGLSKKPTFKVLRKSRSGFGTEEVRTEKVEIDIKTNYNDDFVEVYNEIKKTIDKKESGLILLHGKPGTGKTTYIKSLISDHQDSNFVFIQNEFINNLLDPDFISFLLKQRNAILVIEDAEKVITSREQLREESVVSTILQLTDGLFSDYLNIKVICTFNSNLSKIDTALLRKGRMIAMYEFKPLNIEKTNKLLATVGAENSDKELTISDIFNINKKEFNNIKQNRIGF